MLPGQILIADGDHRATSFIGGRIVAKQMPMEIGAAEAPVRSHRDSGGKYSRYAVVKYVFRVYSPKFVTDAGIFLRHAVDMPRR